MDAYLHADQKAQVLNVLDGSEAALNPKGTLMVCTTNYPEAIDERILKRPGRLDRIFIIPETKVAVDAEKMLRQYLGEMWNDSHARLVPKLVGYPGAFIREVAIHALTQVAYTDAAVLEYAVLEQSYRSLKEQIDARDDFLTERMGIGLQPIALHTNGN
jgi:SpoVK/Ycf46/Vps4 family AAA+-type ATPase